MASAVSTTDASTSSTENELCSVRARSRMARSLARLPPTPGAGAVFSGAPICSISRFSSAPSSANIELVGILRAEFDLVGIPQRLPRDALRR